MINHKIKASCLAMGYLTNADRVRSQVSALKIPQAKSPAYVGAGIKISTVNLKPIKYKTTKAFISDINQYVKQASLSSSQLIVFPELTGMLPISVMPGFDNLLKQFLSSFAESDEVTKLKLFYDTIISVHGFINEIFLNTFSQLAKTYKIAIAGASVYCVEDKKIFNRQYLFSPDGLVSGSQDKLILSPFEHSMGVSRGSKLTPAHSPLGNIALLTSSCLDCYEPFAIAKELMCVAATSSASPFKESFICAPFRTEESGLCLICAGVGDSSEFYFPFVSSPATILAPRVCRQNSNCIVKQDSTQITITARVDMSKVKSSFDLYTADYNPNFYKKLLTDWDRR